MSGMRQKTLNYLIPLWVAVGVSSAIYFQTRLLAPLDPDNRRNFYSLASSFEDYCFIRQEFRTRLWSNGLAALAVRFGEAYPDLPSRWVVEPELEVAIGVWSACWLFATNLCFIIAKRARSLFFVLGTYAGVSFGYMPGLVARIYPWDLPALFCFSLVLILWQRQLTRLVGVFLPLLVGFKETVAVLAIGYLFEPLARKQRLIRFATVLAMCAATKFAIDLVTDNPLPLWTMTTGDASAEPRVIASLQSLLTGHPLLINAGTLVAFLFLPGSSRQLRMLKCIAIAFTIGNFAFATIHEYRIWFEMIPVAMLGFEEAVFPVHKSSFHDSS